MASPAPVVVSNSGDGAVGDDDALDAFAGHGDLEHEHEAFAGRMAWYGELVCVAGDVGGAEAQFEAGFCWFRSC